MYVMVVCYTQYARQCCLRECDNGRRTWQLHAARVDACGAASSCTRLPLLDRCTCACAHLSLQSNAITTSYASTSTSAPRRVVCALVTSPLHARQDSDPQGLPAYHNEKHMRPRFVSAVTGVEFSLSLVNTSECRHRHQRDNQQANA